jgi:hypothetical protein
VSVAVDSADAQSPPRQGLRGKLWIAFVLQIAAISVATLLSVYGAWIVLRDVLINQALVDEGFATLRDLGDLEHLSRLHS